jgi:alkylation response protein AidB-like acyl-CoA dehydrogenase
VIELLPGPDARLYLDSSTQFLDRTMDSQRLRAHADDGGGFAAQWWRSAAELGWTSMLVPETRGGGSVSGSGLLDLAMIAELNGRYAAPGPIAPVNVVTAALVDARGETTHDALLARLMDGSAVASWAMHEPGRSWEPERPALSARRVDGGYALTGAKDRVECGDQADVLLVAAVLDGSFAQFLVPTDAPGVQVTPVWSLDLTRHFATVTFDVELPEVALLCRDDRARELVEHQVQVQLVLQAAETAGATAAVFQSTSQWVLDRFAFGRALGSYQVIKHRMADMVTWLHAMQASVREAVDAVESRTAAASRLARVASVFAAERSLRIIQDCVQIHGGIGVTWEHDLHIYLRRCTTNAAHYGTPDELRRSLGRLSAA